MWCRLACRASLLQQSSEDIIDCLPDLIDYVDGHHERLQALVGPTLSNTQIDQVWLHVDIDVICLPTHTLNVHTFVTAPDLPTLAGSLKPLQANLWRLMEW